MHKKGRRRLRASLAAGALTPAVLALLSIPPASAREWLGTVDTDWFKPANWSGNGLPTASEDTEINKAGVLAAVINGGSALTQTLNLGRTADAGLRIAGGGRLTSLQGVLATEAGHRAEVTIEGAGSSWNVTGFPLFVGLRGVGVLTMTGGATVAAPNVTIGRDVGSSGTAWLAGAATRLSTPGIVRVGTSGAGEMHVTAGAVVSADVTVSIGNLAGSRGAVVADGAGSRIEADFSILTGDTGTGSFTLRNGAVAHTPIFSLGRLASASGSALVEGSGSQVSARNVVVGFSGHGSMEVRSGSAYLSDPAATPGSTTIGVNAGSVGFVVVAGAGSTWTEAGQLNIGDAGAGTMNVESGARVSTGASTLIADLPGSSGALAVDGAGSSFSDGSHLYVGSQGAGSFRVTNGATATVAGQLQVGQTTGPSASLLVDGPGSSVSVGDETAVGVFNAGRGAMTVRNGGRLTSVNFFTLAFDKQSIGTLLVDGTGSSVTTTRSAFLGYMGGAAVDVTNGGLLSASADLFVGAFPGGTTTLNAATGAGVSGRNIYIGLGGNGTVTVSGGATLGAAGPVGIRIASEAGSTGVLNIGAGTGVAVAPGVVSAAKLEFGAGTGTLNLNHTGTAYTLAPPLAGTGTVNVRAGTTILTGDSSGFAGTTNITGGTLRVNGALGGAISLSGGTLGGSGSIGRFAASAGSTVAPGNSIGTMSVAGPVSFAAGSTYAVEIAGSGQSDLIAATGAAALSGGTVAVTNLNPAYVLGSRYTILTAAGGVTGRFAGVTPVTPISTPFLSLSLGYAASAVTLDVIRSGVAFASVATTGNQASTGAGIDSITAVSPLTVALTALPAASVPAALDLLSGEIHATTGGMLAHDSRFPREAILARLESARGDGWQGWGEVLGSWASLDGSASAASGDRDFTGFVAGIDASFGKGRVGLMAGYGEASLDVDARASSSDAESVYLGLYGSGGWGAVELRGGLVYADQQIETERSVAFTGFADRLTANADASTIQGFGEIAGQFEAGSQPGAFTLEPFANLAYVGVSVDDTIERGGSSALAVSGAEMDTVFTTLGLRATARLTDAGAFDIGATGELAWRHAFEDVTPLAAMAFPAGAPFAIAGAPIAEDAGVVALGFEARNDNGLVLAISYSGQFASDWDDNAVVARAGFRF